MKRYVYAYIGVLVASSMIAFLLSYGTTHPAITLNINWNAYLVPSTMFSNIGIILVVLREVYRIIQSMTYSVRIPLKQAYVHVQTFCFAVITNYHAPYNQSSLTISVMRC